MAKKPTGEDSDAAFDAAVKKLRVPRAVLKLWLVDHRKFSPAAWTHWKRGHRQISSEVIDQFLEWLTGEDASWEDGEWIKEYLAWRDREKIARG